MAAISKLDYLKKYLTNEGNKEGIKTKKLKKKIRKTKNLMIIDNDVKFRDDLKQNKHDSIEDEFDLDEERPQIYVDGNTLLSEHNAKKDKEAKQKWAPISKDNEGASGIHSSASPDASCHSLSMKTSTTTGVCHSNSRKSDLGLESDMSPKILKRRHYSPDISPKKYNQRHDSPDLSPPNKRGYENHMSHDLSPTRTRKRHDTPDLSPRRKVIENSPDLSPRRSRKRNDSPEFASKQSHKRHGGSPKMISKMTIDRHDSPDLSPKRHYNKNNSPDLSPKRVTNMKSHRDLSPRRQRRNNSPDLILKHKFSDNSNRHYSRQADDANLLHDKGKQRKEVAPEVITSGKNSGLQSAKAVREENVKRKAAEDKQFAMMESSISGKGATTVFRDKSGRKIDIAEEERKKKEAEEKKAKENEKYDAWRKGLKQKDEYDKQLKSDAFEMSKPLARYQNDTDLDIMLKNQERVEDPMLAFIKKTKSKGKEKKNVKPRYKGPHPPPNRFNIWPGYRWDGVDRSNGFEKKRFSTIAEKQSVAIDAYKWSVEEM